MHISIYIYIHVYVHMEVYICFFVCINIYLYINIHYSTGILGSYAFAKVRHLGFNKVFENWESKSSIK